MLGVHRRACRCHKRPRPLVGEETLSRAHRRRPQPDVHLLACLATGGARALYSVGRMLGLTPVHVSRWFCPPISFTIECTSTMATCTCTLYEHQVSTSREPICGWMVRRAMAPPVHQSLYSRFDTLMSHKGVIFFSGRRCFRRQRDSCDDFINLKTHQISSST
jgi:hypothetical protein